MKSTSASPLPASLERLVNRLQQASTPKQRYEYLLWLAKRLPPFPETE
ncbi:MAG: SufE family protein, partial [Desertifilum sp. SIO1I2]|nr:SufE family protein [Desertifilum sp. SIO1I2]